jgi:hypothetical protein
VTDPSRKQLKRRLGGIAGHVPAEWPVNFAGIRNGKRTFVPGDEIVRLSRLEAEASSTDDPQTTAPERPAI